MSRVRILNLPKDCTEDQLRNHLLTNLPPTAPMLQITDVFLKRGPTGTSADSPYRASGSKNSKSNHHHNNNSSVIRMAFVGFQNATAGKFVVDYFNNTYFRSARLHVELAQGVQAAREAMQEREAKRKRIREEDRERERQEREAKRKKTVTSADDNNDNSSGTTAESVGGGATGKTTTTPNGTNHSTHDTAAAFSKGEERRRQFVEERAGATTGASWTSELLLPSTSTGGEKDHVMAVDEEEVAGATTTTTRKKEKEKEKKKKKKKTNEEEKEGNEEKKSEDEEALLLQRQQALGEMSEMDFLNQLGASSSGPPPPDSDNEDRNEDDERPGKATTDPSEASHQHTKGKGKAAEGEDPSVTKTKKSKPLSPAAVAEAEAQRQERLALDTGRVRLFNFPYVATENQLKHFVTSQIGPIQDIHLPLTRDTRQSKGAAFVRFVEPADAVACLKKLHGSIFMGRLMRVTAAEEDPYQQQQQQQQVTKDAADDDGSTVHALENGKNEEEGGNGDSSIEGGPVAPARRAPPGSSVFKREKDAERRAEEEEAMRHLGEAAGAVPQRWNALYMNSSAAVERVAQRMQLRSEDLVRVETKGAATRAAIAEALLTSETEQVLGDEGIALDVLSASTQNLLRPRSATTILVKNLSLRSAEEAKALSALFAKYGVLEVTAFPQSGLFALFRFSQAQDARVAFRRLSFKLFQGSPLYLEWAPVGAVVEKDEGGTGDNDTETLQQPTTTTSTTRRDKEDEDEEGGEERNRSAAAAIAAASRVFTLFLTNIPFQLQDDDELYAFLLDACPRFASEPEKYIKRIAFEKDKGRAFITLDCNHSLHYAQRQWHGKKLRDRVLSCVPSKANLPAAPAAAATTPLTGFKTNEAEEDDEEPPTRLVHPTSSLGVNNSNVPPGCDPLKLVVKNVPFEATEQDVRALFSAFSEVRSVRLPRKAQQFSHHRENHHRGFAFVEFLSESEAARALQTLRATHLYGRHLVLAYAKAEQ